ncbi:response regulator [Luteococcus sp. Sow4_B9]|uniref:response regulator n=1 Tax=Luteococcus sp. Sow4_B9 TaxID=3438792 RepID=UPI003F94ADB7
MIRILLADDETLIRDALAGLLGLEENLEVVAVAASGTEAVAAARHHRPDICLLDLQMPGLDGIEAAAQILANDPGAGCILVTSHGRPGHLKKALATGVRGFLPKTAPAVELARVIQLVHEGGRHVDPQLAAEAIAAGDSPLTARESDVLELAADGAPIEEIALRAHLSPGTVRNYLSSAVAKLGTANRHEAIALARRRGWL